MEKGDGLSFSELAYPLLQGWDWWQLFKERNIQMQIGGSDQFGNITAGIDALNHISKNRINPEIEPLRAGPLSKPVGFTVPLLTTAAGEKFGKSAGNAVWLDPEMTSTFELYQVGLCPTSRVVSHSHVVPVLPPFYRRRRWPLPTALHPHSSPRNIRNPRYPRHRALEASRAAPSSP